MKLSSDLGFSILQAGDMDLAESLVINMAGWSALNLLRHWRSEIECGLSRKRDKCCIVSGMTIVHGVVMPTEWWNIYFFSNSAKLQYQILSTENGGSWEGAENWWEKISAYRDFNDENQRISEWDVTKSDLEIWCNQCDVLLNAVQTLENG